MTQQQFKVLQFSDSHLGKAMYGMHQRIFDHSRVLQEVRRVAVEEKVDLVVDGGDTTDTPEPDPHSIKEYRFLAETLRNSAIPLISVVGNHNIHRITSRDQDSTWLDAIGSVERIVTPPGMAPRVTKYRNRAGQWGINVAAFDWMPAAQIPEALGRIEKSHGIDLLVMHQSCEGLLPDIGNPELQLKLLEEKTRVLAVGDIHLNKVLKLPDGTFVSSSGSTELCSIGEPLQKFVNLITYTHTGHGIEVEIRPIKIRTRPVLVLQATAAIELDGILSQVRDVRHTTGMEPLVVLKHDRGIGREAMALRKELADSQLSNMVRLVPEILIKIEQAVEIRESTALDMPAILQERLEKKPMLAAAAVELWNNPQGAEAILANLRKQLAPQAAPAPSMVPGEETPSLTPEAESLGLQILKAQEMGSGLPLKITYPDPPQQCISHRDVTTQPQQPDRELI